MRKKKRLVAKKMPNRGRAVYGKCLSAILAAGMILAACGMGGSANTQATYQISPTFRELYEKLGGQEVLGPAISKPFKIDPYDCQYTVNVLICVNPQSTDAGRLFFYPLGNEMNLHETPTQTPSQNGSTVVDGYAIYDEFVPLYSQLGAAFAGKPLTQVHINYSQQRIEQFFENIGFYRKFSDPVGSVHLLAYGAYACTDKCNYTPSMEAAVLSSSRAAVDQPLLAGLSELVDTSILGDPLTQPYIASDGMEEQVYANAIVFAPVNDLNAARLRPLSKLLNIPRTDPEPQKYSSKDGMVFYATSGTKGYHVPLVFDQFIAAHGGTDASGEPIDEVYQFNTTIYRQCFENYCLDYNSAASGGKKVGMAPLGLQYMQQIAGSQPAPASSEDLSSGNLVLSISEESNQVSPGSQQQIVVQVMQRKNGQPVANIQATIMINLPDGSQYTGTFPATGVDGRAAITVPVMKNIPNGTILEYKVCVNGTDGVFVCASNSYLIWPNG